MHHNHNARLAPEAGDGQHTEHTHHHVEHEALVIHQAHHQGQGGEEAAHNQVHGVEAHGERVSSIAPDC